ncbi:MAG TPA: winged helix-turn-helix domain-containing protein [Anaerolineae bacterium]
MIRDHEISYLMNAVRDAECASIIGLSNMGKSTLMRALCHPDVRNAYLGERCDDWLFIYIDCNLMPERSEQALHEVILRNAIEALRHAGAKDDILARLDRLYEQVIQPQTPIRSPLAFNDAINVLCDESGRALVLLFDEFDDPFGKLDGRTFLNLRAIKDHLAGALTYITATEQPLVDVRVDREATEFIELFASRQRWLGFMNAADTAAVVREFTTANRAVWQPDEVAFVVDQAGGHPGLLQAVMESFMHVAGSAPTSTRQLALSVAKQAFEADDSIRRECAQLWVQLSEDEHAELIASARHDPGMAEVAKQLQMKHLLASDGEDAAHRPLIGEVWMTFIKRQALMRPAAERGVRVDIESGEVFVDGRRLEQLTELEYKLIVLLNGRANRIVDKYAIVTDVWGEKFIEEVDDARIEKLVSRLRAKLEPNAEEPRYLITVRGRGYKLVR